MMALVADSLTEIVVVNDYASMLDPRRGAVTVTVDRRRVGKAPQGGELRWMVAPGAHTVRIQLRHFYMSPRVTVETVQGRPSVLRANKPAGPALKAMWRLLFRPFTSLSLEHQAPHHDLGPPRPRPELDATALRRRRRAFQIYAVSMALFFSALIIVSKLSG
jgi:hypothetical protein